MRDLAFFDIDGVLANDTHRVDHALATPRRWSQYFAPSALAADGVWEQGRELLNQHASEGWLICYMTGRREDLRWVTQAWLSRHGFPVGALYMRPMKVKVPLARFKADLMERMVRVADGARVVLYDDDPEVIRVVQERLGEEVAVHCTWHVKQTALVKSALT